MRRRVGSSEKLPSSERLRESNEKLHKLLEEADKKLGPTPDVHDWEFEKEMLKATQAAL